MGLRTVEGTAPGLVEKVRTTEDGARQERVPWEDQEQPGGDPAPGGAERRM